VVGNVCRHNLRDFAVQRTICLDQLGRRPPLKKVTVLKRRVRFFLDVGGHVSTLKVG